MGKSSIYMISGSGLLIAAIGLSVLTHIGGTHDYSIKEAFSISETMRTPRIGAGRDTKERRWSVPMRPKSSSSVRNTETIESQGAQPSEEVLQSARKLKDAGVGGAEVLEFLLSSAVTTESTEDDAVYAATYHRMRTQNLKAAEFVENSISIP